jgi:hypothetical protein
MHVYNDSVPYVAGYQYYNWYNLLCMVLFVLNMNTCIQKNYIGMW